MRLAILFLLATMIHVHSVPPNAMVQVKTCSGKWADIYADRRMTVRLPNPFLANSDGSYEFYTPDTCVEAKQWRTK
jgi:hypothetical protein